MSATAQRTLSGGTTEDEYSRPDTFLWCDECEDWYLRSQRHAHPHDLVDSPDSVTDEGGGGGNGGGDEDEDDEPREVGGMFTVTRDFSVKYTTTVAAADEDQALEIAKEQHSWSEDTPVDAVHLNNEVRKQETLTEDDERMDDVPGWPW